jgi:hypothetical protein
MNPDLLDQLRALLGPSRTVSTPRKPIVTTAPAQEMAMGPRGTEPSYAPPSGTEQAVGMARDMASYMRNNPVETAMSFVPGVGEVQDAVTGVREALQGNLPGAAASLGMAGAGFIGGPIADVVSKARRIPASARDMAVVQNPNFRRWFGNSTAQAEGLPLTLSHGTNASGYVAGRGPTDPMENVAVDFDAFRMPSDGMGQLGIHVGVDPRQSDKFSTWANDPKVFESVTQNAQSPWYDPESFVKTAGRTLPLYGRAENPLRLEDLGSWHSSRMSDSLLRSHPELWNDLRQEAGMPIWQIQESRMRDLLEGRGFDSIIYRNRYEGVPTGVMPKLEQQYNTDPAGYSQIVGMGGVRHMPEEDWLKAWPEMGDSYIMFSPNQLKSAIGNDGGFRRNTNNLNRGLLLGLLGGGAAGGLGEYVANSAPPEG